MAIMAPFLVIETAAAPLSAADGTFGPTRLAVLLVTALAGRDTFVTVGFITMVANLVALIADRRPAPAARPLVVAVDHLATVRAVHAVPVGERDVRAIRVVGLQQAPHDREEVPQPAFLQGVADRLAPFALADNLALDVRVRDVLVADRRIRVESDHAIR